MRKSAIIFIAVFFHLIPSKTCFSDASPSQDTDAQKVVKKLIAEKYFKTATCSFVTSHFLIRAGLPEIGKSTFVSNRSDIDRSQEKLNPPILSDGLTYPDGSPRVEIKTEITDPKHWKLSFMEWIRFSAGKTPSRPKPLLITSQLVFSLEPKHAMTACELQEIQVNVSPPGSQTATTRSLQMKDCIDQSLFPEQDPWYQSEILKPAFDQIQKDCHLALQFFPLH